MIRAGLPQNLPPGVPVKVIKVNMGMASLLSFQRNILSVYVSDATTMDARGINARTLAVTGVAPGKSTLAVFTTTPGDDAVGQLHLFHIVAQATTGGPLRTVADPGATSGPLPTVADPAAYALLKAAHDSRQVLPDDFPGFTADVTFNDNGKDFKGTLHYKRGEESQVKFDGLDKDTDNWVQDQLLSIIGHRRGGDFAQGDGKYPLSLGPDDGNAFGRLVNINDKLQSSYRVRDKQVTEVTRTMGDSRFTISVIQTKSTEGGKYLPQHFIVSYRDAKTGALQEVQAFRDAYQQLGGAWLPLSRTVVTFDKETTPHMRSLRFDNVQVLPATAPKAP